MEGLFPQDLPLIPRGWQPGFQEEDTASLFICPQPTFFPALLLNYFLGLLLKAIQTPER